MKTEMTDTLKDIELTDEAKKHPQEIVFVRDLERAEALDDPVRFSIITVLRKGIADTQTTETKDEETGDRIIRQREIKRYALSVVEIVKLSSKIDGIEEISKNQVYHHLPKLIEAGFVIKYGTVTTGKRTTDYYTRTAKGFVVTAGSLMDDKKMLRKKTEKNFDRMLKVFNLSLTDEEVASLKEMLLQKYVMQNESRSKIADLIAGDVADKEILDMYQFLSEIHAAGNEKYLELYKKLHDLIFKE